MKIDITQLGEFLDIEIKEETTNDELQKAFQEKFIRRDSVHNDDEIVNSIVGKRIGSLETTVKQLARENKIEFGDDLKDAKIEDLISHTVKSLNDSYAKTVTELKDSIDNSDFQKQLEDWETKYGKLNDKYTQTNDLLSKRNEEFDSYKQMKEGELTTFKLTTGLNEIKKQAKYKSNITEIERKGFDAHLSDNFKFEFDDDGSIVPFDKSTGKRIENPDKMGTFMSASELINRELATQKLNAVNDNAEKEKKKVSAVSAPVVDTNDNGRVINSRSIV